MKKKQYNFPTKLMAIILCVLMVVTLAVTSIYMLIDLIKGEDKDDTKTEAAIVEVVKDYTC